MEKTNQHEAMNSQPSWRKSKDFYRVLNRIRAQLRDMDSKLEYLIEQNSEHFRCLAGYEINDRK